MDTENYEELYKKIYYKFKDKDLLKAALSHPSLCYSKRNKCMNYERLELLGDSVLSLVVLDMLLTYYKDFDEGEIAKRKSYLVCTEALSKIGQSIDLGKYIYMTKGEEKLDGRNNPRIIENVMESIIGAIYKPPYAKNYYDNYYNLDGTNLYISSGIGVSTINYRLFNHPSINFYRINKEN